MDYRHVLQHGTVLDRKYRIERVIGSGGFGITYEAFDLGLATPVAIKEYYPAQFGLRDATLSVRARSEGDRPIFERLLASFIREARTLARFDHPAIVRVLNVFEAHGTAYMVMKYEVGPSLKQWLAELGRAPTQFELDRIAAPVLDALETLHDTAYLHRDIAPDNIIIRADGTPVILDFGASRRVVTEMTGTVTGIVKQGYSPQEQYATDGRQQGPWTDIYAFGATLYRAIAGDAPNEATERMLDDLMRPAVEFANGDYRMEFLEGLDWSLRLRPRERPQSIGEWRQKLFRGTYLEQAGGRATFPVSGTGGNAPGGWPPTHPHSSGPQSGPRWSAPGGAAPPSGPPGPAPYSPATSTGTRPGDDAARARRPDVRQPRRPTQRMALAGGGLLVVAGLFVFALLPRGTAVTPQGNVAVTPAAKATDPAAALAEEALLRARAEADRRAREQEALQQAAARRAAEEAAAAERAAAEKAAAERAAAEKAEAEKAAAERAATRQRARKEAAARAEAERLAAEKAAAERAEAERLAREAAEALAREREAQRVAALRAAEAERAAREQAERRAREEAAARAKADAERRAREDAQRAAAAKAAADRQAREEAERRAREEAQAAQGVLDGVRRELVRVGCLPSGGGGPWGSADRAALLQFARLSGLQLDGAPTQEALAALTRGGGTVCRTSCASDEALVDGRCVASRTDGAQRSQSSPPTVSCSEINERAQIGLLTEADRAVLRAGTCR